jgi:hypothetical protein
MIKFIYIILFIILILAPQISRAEGKNFFIPEYDIYAPGYLLSENDRINPDIINQNKETEGPLRRFEVAFFISLPFVFIVNFLAFHAYEVIRQEDFNVNVWEEHQVLLPACTLAVTTAVAFRAAYIGSGSAQRDGAVRPEGRSVFMCAVRNY